MNGALSNMPIGILDPRSQAIAQMGMSLLASGGPSRMPVSFGQSLGQAGTQGLQAFQQAQQAQQQEALRQLQMKKIEEEMRRAQEKAMQPPAPLTVSPGTQVLDPQTLQVRHTVPFRPEMPKPVAPVIRTFREGDQDITREYVDGQWVERSRGRAFAPKGDVSTAGRGKPPTGYQWSADGTALEAIPGGPKDTSAKDAARFSGAVQKADIVMKKVDEALDKTGFFTTGLTGKVLGAIPGTPAFDLDRTIDTLKAQIGFSELQAMREASPTGGALGQVAVQELNMLQSTIASLEPGQSEQQVKRALEQVRTHFQNWKQAVMASKSGNDLAAPSAEPTAAPTSFPTPPQDAVRRLKMNPKEREQFDAIFGPGSAAKALGK